ncbi:MAG TPA: hypothetical protein ENJ20_02990 [Bacteroidetes bacterium]|nr:hypothetical protein [Bacteroidota bacterium]
MTIAVLGLHWSALANLSATVTNATAPCPNGDDGQIDLHVNGGVAPFTFFWTGPNGCRINHSILYQKC